MTLSRRDEVKELYYICGQCGLEQEYLPSQKPPKACRDCGYVHGTRKPDDVPSEIKIRLNDYN